MYIPYPQFEYRLSLFYLNSCLLSQLHLPPSNSVFLHLYSEIQDRIYCGRSIKAEAKVRSNSAITDQHRHHRSSPTPPIQIRFLFGHDLNSFLVSTGFRLVIVFVSGTRFGCESGWSRVFLLVRVQVWLAYFIGFLIGIWDC